MRGGWFGVAVVGGVVFALCDGHGEWECCGAARWWWAEMRTC